MSIYKENKNFINRFVSTLEKSKKNFKCCLSVKIPILLNGRYFSPFMFSNVAIKNVVTCEVGHRLFFCVTTDLTSREFGARTYGGNSTYQIFMSSYGKWSTSKQEMDLLINFLKSKGVNKTADGKDFSNVDASYMVSSLKAREDYYGKVFQDYPDVKTLDSYIKKLGSADIDTFRSPSVYKSIKDKSIIPVAYFDGEILYTPERFPSSRTTTSFYEKTNISGPLNSYLLGLLTSNSLNMTPFSYWVVPNFKSCDFIDIKKFMGSYE